MSQKTLECFGGPLDGERRPVSGGQMLLKEKCEYAKHHPEHLYPIAVYFTDEDSLWGAVWRFDRMEP